MKKGLSKIDVVIKILFFAGLTILYIFVYSLNKNIKKIDTRAVDQPSPSKSLQGLPQVQLPAINQSCTEFCIEEINGIVAEAIKVIPPSIERKVVEESKITGSTVYVPLGGVTATATSTDWVDVNGTDVFIDALNDYGKSAKFSWEAFLKVAHGNGQAFARLYDDTNKIAVNGSEFSSIDSDTYQLLSSGDLNLWAGRNLYKVQVKSLNSFEITFSGGRIKVSY